MGIMVPTQLHVRFDIAHCYSFRHMKKGIFVKKLNYTKLNRGGALNQEKNGGS